MFTRQAIFFFLSFLLHGDVFCFEEWVEIAKTLRSTVNELYGRKMLSHDDCISVGPRPSSPLDFPTGDKNKTKIIRDVWKRYHNCLRTKIRAIQKYGIGTLPPYTIAAFSGSSVQLDCNVCVSPEDLTFTPEWRFMTKNNASLFESVLVDEDDHREISAYTSALHFYNVEERHQGLYYCQLKTDLDAPYILHVLKTKMEPVREARPATSKIGPSVRNPVIVPRSPMALWNEWTDWTECSACGKVGKRSRIGFCKISLREHLPQNVTSRLEPAQLNETFEVSKVVVESTEKLLKTMVYGIPCRSLLLRQELRQTVLLQTFPTQVETALCKVACPPSRIVEVIDRNGSVIERYNNTAGDYFALQELPIIPTGPKRVSLYADEGQAFFLPCPSKRDTNVPVEWSVNGKIWLKDTVEAISNNRISINNFNEITFQKVKKVDAKVYSCWQGKTLVGVVRLRLNKVPSFIEEYNLTATLYPRLMFLSMITTLGYITFKMFLNREKAKAASARARKRTEKSVPLLKDTT